MLEVTAWQNKRPWREAASNAHKVLKVKNESHCPSYGQILDCPSRDGKHSPSQHTCACEPCIAHLALPLLHDAASVTVSRWGWGRGCLSCEFSQPIENPTEQLQFHDECTWNGVSAAMATAIGGWPLPYSRAWVLIAGGSAGTWTAIP